MTEGSTNERTNERKDENYIPLGINAGGIIIDLTIASTVLSNKISNWKVQHEVYLNTDHNLITFHVGEEGS